MGVREAASYQLPVTSGKKKTCYAALIMVIALVLCGCGSSSSHAISRIALLAPFEGRYREVGYNAYYAARLALMDSGTSDVELLAIDDGGSVNSAVERAKALVKDPLVKAVLAFGYAAAEPKTQAAFGTVPVIIVGEWGSQPEKDHVFMLASAQLDNLLTTPGKFDITDAPQLKTPIVGSDVLALAQFTELRRDTDGVEIVSSAALPDDAFRERYLNSGLFVPEPGLLATLTYDAANMVLQAIQSGDTQAALESMTYVGINGAIHFDKGYWADAPVHYYCYAPNVTLQLCEHSSSK